MSSNISKRRKLRALEAKRDALSERQAKDKVALAALRAELKSMRKNG